MAESSKQQQYRYSQYDNALQDREGCWLSVVNILVYVKNHRGFTDSSVYNTEIGLNKALKSSSRRLIGRQMFYKDASAFLFNTIMRQRHDRYFSGEHISLPCLIPWPDFAFSYRSRNGIVQVARCHCARQKVAGVSKRLLPCTSRLLATRCDVPDVFPAEDQGNLSSGVGRLFLCKYHLSWRQQNHNRNRSCTI